MVERVFSPDKKSYILYRPLQLLNSFIILYGILYIFFLSLSILAIGFEIDILLDILLFFEGKAYIVAIGFLSIVVGYKAWLWKTHGREAYFIQDDRVTVKKGDKRITLPLNKVRGVKRVYTVVETGLFSTGTVELESIDGEQTLKLRNLESPEDVATIIEQNMTDAGVPVTKKDVVHEDIPAAPFYKTRIYGMLLAVTTITVFFTGLIMRDPSRTVEPLGFVISMVGLFIFLLTVWLIPDYFERSRRTYTLYEDAIEYKKGYFKKEDITYPLHHVESVELGLSVSTDRYGYGMILLNIRGEDKTIDIEGVKHPETFLESIHKRIKE